MKCARHTSQDLSTYEVLNVISCSWGPLSEGPLMLEKQLLITRADRRAVGEKDHEQGEIMMNLMNLRDWVAEDQS